MPGIGENGHPNQIAARYRQAMQLAEHLENESDLSTRPLGTAIPSVAEGEEKPSGGSANVVADTPAAQPPRVEASVDRAFGNAHAGTSRRRFAISCGTAMVVASLTCMYFRGDIITRLTQHADQTLASTIASAPAEFPMQASADPTRRQPEAETRTAVPTPALGTVAKALTDDNDRAPNGLADAPTKPKEELGSIASKEPSGSPGKAREGETNELRQSLQQDQTRISALRNAFGEARQHREHSSQSHRSRHLFHRRIKERGPSFFGFFTAPRQARAHHSRPR